MKILYINSGAPDYLSDCIFHGLRNLYGSDVIDFPKMEYMYDNFKKFTNCFVPFHTLKDIEIDRNNIFEKILDKYFDVIIYSSIQRNKSYLLFTVENFYCISLDGEDHTDIDQYCHNINYFKRELIYENNTIKPISFSYPEELISTLYKKEKTCAHVIPGFKDTYIFNNQKDYFDDYNKSLFAFTWKKGGWDCMRHYEIIFNNCLPLFLDIENCPKNTLTFLPKDLLIEAKNLKGIKIEIKNNRPNVLIDDLVFDESKYLKLLNSTIDHCKKTLTTKKMAEYILNKKF